MTPQHFRTVRSVRSTTTKAFNKAYIDIKSPEKDSLMVSGMQWQVSNRLMLGSARSRVD
jgi:hypothetical protein